MKMVKFLLFYSLSLLLLTVSGDKDSEVNSVSFHVSEDDIHEVAYSIPVADKWVNANIVNSKVPTIVVVGGGVLCNANYEDYWSLILPAIENIYFSVTRLGLEKQTKVSTIVPTDCLDIYKQPSKFKEALADSHLKPLLNFLQNTNSSYLLHPSSYLSLSSHRSAIEELGISLDIDFVKENRIKSRKLGVESFPAEPSSVKHFIPSPLSPSIKNSVPGAIGKHPFPPDFPLANPPSLSFSFPPGIEDPVNFPTFPPAVSPPPSDDFGFPPCGPVHKEPKASRKYGLWCVAKPTVPEDTLQEAMDYACGDGDADCEEIMPQGSCYYPNTVSAHASYAFNSYWQKAKSNGGSCDFGGTAMLITSDPSFFHCHYALG